MSNFCWGHLTVVPARVAGSPAPAGLIKVPLPGRVIPPRLAHTPRVSAYQQRLVNSDSPHLFQRVRTGEKMVQIQLPEQEKPLGEGEEGEERRRDVESGRGEAPLLSTSFNLPKERRQRTNKRSFLLPSLLLTIKNSLTPFI